MFSGGFLKYMSANSHMLSVPTGQADPKDTLGWGWKPSVKTNEPPLLVIALMRTDVVSRWESSRPVPCLANCIRNFFSESDFIFDTGGGGSGVCRASGRSFAMIILRSLPQTPQWWQVPNRQSSVTSPVSDL